MIAAILLAGTIAAGTPVIAVVDEIRRNGMEDRIEGGGVITWTVVDMTILDPQGYGKKFSATCPGPPFVGRDHMWVGERLTFRMPPNVPLEPVSLESLNVQPYIAEGSIPQAAAKRIFEEARVAAADDDGKLWGRSLYGPLMLVDPKTRDLFRNDLFTAKLPANIVVANTATVYEGELTTMVSWASLQGLKSSQRRVLLMHECWHRIQKDLGFPPNSPNNQHLDTVDGRVWLQLELRALAAALRATGDARKAAIGDAVAFRAARRAAFAGSEENERGLENNEGLAEYTGWALRGTTAEESRLALAPHLEKGDPSASFVRGFAYQTGPAYGLLLDAIKPGWTRSYKVTDDLAAFTGIAPAALHGEAYGETALRAAEETRDREQRERVAHFRARLVDGPTLELPMIDAHYGFDPDTVVALGDAGSGYPTLQVTAPWGRIAVENGARIVSDFTAIVVSAEDRPKLQLNAGWKIVPGKRPGDLRVVHE